MWEIWRSRSHQNLYALGQRQAGRDGTHSPDAGTPTSIARIASGTVNFKDLSIRPEALEPGNAADIEDDRHSEDSTNKSAILLKAPKMAERTKYVIILVGLPGRGKTFLCNKLKCYLNWLGHSTRHFNVGSYRRLQKGDAEVQTADFFDAHNHAGMEARNRALYAALDDLQSYLFSPDGQVAIFDATNTTEERRQLLIRAFHGRFQYLFIESICTDTKVLEQNYRFKMQYSPDYTGMNMQQSLDDFKARIHKYEEVYEPIEDRNIHYIKLIDMVTGRGHMDVNRISGYLPGKIVFFLMQVCKAGMAQARRIWLTRHGQSEYNLVERIGGDSNLAVTGEVYARCLPEMLLERLPLVGAERMPPGSSDEEPQAVPVSVWTSTLRRTIQTARYLPFPKLRWKALDEIQAGGCDGMTYEEVARQTPDEFMARQKDKLRYRYPAGESYLDVIQRLEPVIIEMEREKECIVVVGHQAVLRAILGYFMAKPLASIPTLDIPLHTLMELRPRPDGTMDFEYIPMSLDTAAAMGAAMAAQGPSILGSGSYTGSPSAILSPQYSSKALGGLSPSLGGMGAGLFSSRFGIAGLTSGMGGGAAAGGGGGEDAETPSARGEESAVATAGATAWGARAPAATSPSVLTLPVLVAGGSAATTPTGPFLTHNHPHLHQQLETVMEVSAAGSPVSLHSRVPSLAAGLGGGGGGSSTSGPGTSGLAATGTAGSPSVGCTNGAVAIGGGLGGGGSVLDSPAALAAALAAAAESRTRVVRVPYGATMGGGGSEGGAPPDLLPHYHSQQVSAAHQLHLQLQLLGGGGAGGGGSGSPSPAAHHPPASPSRLLHSSGCSPSSLLREQTAELSTDPDGEVAEVSDGGGGSDDGSGGAAAGLGAKLGSPAEELCSLAALPLGGILPRVITGGSSSLDAAGGGGGGVGALAQCGEAAVVEEAAATAAVDDGTGSDGPAA